MKKFGLIHQLVLLTFPLALTACGEKPKDDRVEERALPLYESLVSENRYCEALKVTKMRFDYVTDYQTSDRKLYARVREWDERARNAQLNCRKERWPARVAYIQAEVEKKTTELVKYNELLKISAFIPTDSFGKDAVERDCMYDVVIHNPTAHRIASFGFVAQKPFEADADKSGGYPAFDEHTKPQDPVTIEAGETRRIRMCNFSFGGPFSPLRTAQVVKIPLDITHVTLEPKEEFLLDRYRDKEDGYDFDSDIRKLKKQLVDENPHHKQQNG